MPVMMTLLKLRRYIYFLLIAAVFSVCVCLMVSLRALPKRWKYKEVNDEHNGTGSLPNITKDIFGSDIVVIASSSNLSTWLSLDSRPCKDHEEKTLTFRYMDVKLVCKKTNEPCYIWYWDVANWTLIYTNEVMSPNTLNPSRFCPTPIHGERTAKIIQPDGKVDYPGCTIKNYACAPMSMIFASFDYKLKQRINRSPCCRKHLVEITLHMGRVFDKYNITYFLVGGPVISMVRDNGVLIPYDTDTDAAVDANDVEKVDKALPELQAPGYFFEWQPHKAKGLKRYMVGCTNKKECLIGPGIAFYSVDGDMLTAPAPEWPSLPVNLTVPPISRKFEGVEMKFPREPEKYLDYYYGKDKWKTPLQCTVVSGGGKCSR